MTKYRTVRPLMRAISHSDPGDGQPQQFNQWLGKQLKAQKMTQRQLAQQSGVNHASISRLVRGERLPSLATASKLASALRGGGDRSETANLFGLAPSLGHPTAGVEDALRSDDLLGEPQVRQVMQYYLALRVRRLAGRAR